METRYPSMFLNREVALFNSLRLLGFDERRSGLRLTAGLFTNSNPSAGDKIFHFLFSRLRPKSYEEDFRGVWPHHRKAEASAFRKIVHGFVYELENINAIPKSNSSRSTLANCQGERFVKLLQHLARYALQLAVNALPSASIFTEDIDGAVKDFQQDGSFAVKKLGLFAQRYLEANVEAVMKQTQARNLSKDITEQFHRLTEKEDSLKRLEILMSSRAAPSSSSLQEMLQHLEMNKQFTDLCIALSSGAASDVIRENNHRFAIRGDGVRVFRKPDASDSVGEATAKPALEKAVKKLSSSDGSVGRGIFHRVAFSSPAKAHTSEKQTEGDGVLSWGRMVHNLRSSLDSPSRPVNPKDEWNASEVDLVDTLKGLIDASEHAVRPITSQPANVHGNLENYLLKMSGGREKIHSHAQNLQTVYLQHQQHLTETQELRRQLGVELLQVDGRIKSLTLQTDDMMRKEDATSKLGQEAEVNASSHGPQEVENSPVLSTPAKTPLNSDAVFGYLSGTTYKSRIVGGKPYVVYGAHPQGSVTHTAEDEESYWPLITFEEDPDDFSVSAKALRESIRREAKQGAKKSDQSAHVKDVVNSAASVDESKARRAGAEFPKRLSILAMDLNAADDFNLLDPAPVDTWGPYL